jgi:hypothetical protein
MSLRLHSWASNVELEFFLFLWQAVCGAFAVYFHCSKCLFMLGVPEGSGPTIE